MITFFERYVESLRERVVSATDPEDVFFNWKPGEIEWELEQLQREDLWESVDMENLLLAIPDPVRTAMGFGMTWIAGGFVRRWLAGEDMFASDIDLFFPRAEDKQATVALLLGAGFQIYFQCPEGKLTSLKLEYEDGARPTLVQCISQDYYRDPIECIKTFDFTVSQFALTGTHLYMCARSLRDLNAKALQLAYLPFPAATMRRMVKYAKDGYRLTEECALDFLAAVRSDAIWRWDNEGGNLPMIEGGTFEDGTPAGVREDFNRWYID